MASILDPKYPDQKARPDDPQKPIPGVNMPRSRMTTEQIMQELDRQGATSSSTEMPPPAGPSTAPKEAPRQFEHKERGDPEPDNDADDVNMAKYDWDKCIADQKKAGHSEEAAARICGAIRAKSQGK